MSERTDGQQIPKSNKDAELLHMGTFKLLFDRQSSRCKNVNSSFRPSSESMWLFSSKFCTVGALLSNRYPVLGQPPAWPTGEVYNTRRKKLESQGRRFSGRLRKKVLSNAFPSQACGTEALISFFLLGWEVLLFASGWVTWKALWSMAHAACGRPLLSLFQLLRDNTICSTAV